METRRLGRTGIDASVIGLGTEHLHKKPRKTVVSVIHEAIDRGVSYFDLVFSFSDYRDNLGAAFKGRRHKVVVAGHIGCAETDGRYRKTRFVRECDVLFHDLLKRLDTDHIDVLVLQFVDKEEDYEEIMKPHGLMDLARRLQKEGKARAIGLSGHKIPVALKAVKSGEIDVLMFPLNLAWNVVPGREEILQACVEEEVGLVAMKVFAGGRIFQKREGKSVTPAQCLHYALSQTGVSTVVPGVRNLNQLIETLRYLCATNEEKDFNSIVRDFQEDLEGNCVYCNHCLPCPAGIDIGRTIQKLDKILAASSDKLKTVHKTRSEKRSFYYPGRIRTARGDLEDHSGQASACTECGVCMERCPFGVDVISEMKKAAELLETKA
ncbi:MAG: aldo/keto reductase [Candidatus Zixiibacteriota bacterium]|nr:MAG: aldo/keto reductase [candidate division Zixibacteria bacterium]